MKISGNVKEISVTQSALGRSLGLSAARINQMIKEGIVIPNQIDDNGGVMLFESLKNYFQSKATPVGDEDIDFNKEHARYEKIRADKEELRLGLLKGELYEAKTVETVMANIYVTLRTQLLGIPNKLASQMPSEIKAQVDMLLNKEIEACLMEMSQYDPDMFRSEVEET